MLSGDEVPPGGEGKIGVTVRSGYRQQTLRHTVTVHTNDPVNEVITLLVTAKVLVDLEAKPNLLRFDPKQSESASLVIKNYTDNPVHLSEIHSSNSSVDLAISALTIPPNGEVTVTGKLLPDAPTGVLSGWLTIRTDLNTIPLLQIRIWGHLP
ncbi:hypothetical protein U27_02781 [Candidatus Vecturithrix granuli]|uniref:Uncharacterized protein n=1 Tax=Vecturithrix granuli TaxID=1499967 RepID=A0A081BU17_VECG1|nr:hypothetical protein U27_02781 [Candidatus Vecturithrix granuli]